MSDEDLAVALLAATPTHENRDPALLRRWARVALEFGDELAARPFPVDVRVVERDGGVRDGEVVLAEYHRRTGVATVHADALRRVRHVARQRGWDVDPGALRAAAVAHEVAHHRLHGPLARELKRRLGHHALRLGRVRVLGHVVGADELVAHRYAHRVSGLDRSPLALTAALADSLALVAQGG
ncbi:hypothetical protein [Actinosynnema mirum]|uniref:Uncharacterized protein n=1 Tax=Actinosynnema mirum (strain ATCC 29888 / DSM 43827 / JCM 3225 / NBRC 14064 / NCIMB 13271 / NRRL B-12336 / IMRU 3971 / 101) TaxID=446462 RepID=C6W9R8_ACTMD|nr:hypothetical protein [Actinosynnema mirum]ACU37285.1 hypothetical protein Amir_3385 [Actinosynnema mirum DSM 43827]